MTEPATPAPAERADGLLEAPSPRKALGFALFVIACVAVVLFTPARDWIEEGGVEGWRKRVDAWGIWAPAAFVCVYALLVSVGFLRVPLAMLAGALFGFVSGALLSQWGALLGSCLTFFAGRAFGGPALARWVESRFPRAQRLLAFVAAHGFSSNVLLRWSPVGHPMTTNLLMSMSAVRPRDFVLGAFVGLLPYSIVGALLGSAAKGENWIPRVVGAVLGVAAMSIVAGWWIRRRSRVNSA